MKQKIGTLIEEDIMRLAKRRAVEEGRPLSDLIQDALVQYLRKDAATPKERKMAYHLRTTDENTPGATSLRTRTRHVGSMNLDDIPGGSLCVLNANILVHAEPGVSLQAQRLMRRIEEPGRDWPTCVAGNYSMASLFSVGARTALESNLELVTRSANYPAVSPAPADAKIQAGVPGWRRRSYRQRTPWQLFHCFRRQSHSSADPGLSGLV